MSEGENKCYEHATFIKNVLDVSILYERFDKILTRINIILGGIAVSCVLLSINILLK
jgi:hypothetical protein